MLVDRGKAFLGAAGLSINASSSFERPAVVLFVLMTCGIAPAVFSEAAAMRTIPSRLLPIPDTVSPQLQKALALPAPALSNDPEDWEKAEIQQKKARLQALAAFEKQSGTRVSTEIIGGVLCYRAKPRWIPPQRRGRLVVHLHGGGYIQGGGPAVGLAAARFATLLSMEVLSVDYRLAPKAPFPAAINDAMAVWQRVVRQLPRSHLVLLGGSSGGAMVFALTQRARHEGIPLPAAVVSISPWSDMSKTGDSYFTNAGIDSGLVRYENHLEAMARAYAGSMNRKDPLLSPVYGEFRGFPPTFLVSGTRDLFLSNTVRVQQKLLEANVATELVVYEAASHGEIGAFTTPEGLEMYRQIGRFLDAHWVD